MSPTRPPTNFGSGSTGERDEATASVPAGDATASAPPGDYESAVAELEQLVERMEEGRLPLEDSLAAYRRGVDLVRFCRERLAVVEQRVRVLEAGLLQPFEGGESEAEP